MSFQNRGALLPAQADMAIHSGTRLGHYIVRTQIGRGGMGEVYLAYDTRLGRPAALKLLPAQYTRDADRLRRFEQEARTTSALTHPNILTIYEIGQADSIQFIATEFIDGETLRQHLAHTQMTLSRVLDIVTQVAAALTAAHAVGIVHRDIKPENIMLRKDGYVKVLDFGLAKLTEGLPNPDADSELSTAPWIQTDSGIVMGTINYTSPEHLRRQKVDGRTDIWSLGVVLYEMIAGRVPFEGPTTSDVIASILEREHPALARYSPEAPAELSRIVAKALRKDREERYQTAKDMLVDLKSLRQDLEFEAKLERTRQTDGKTKVTVTANEFVADTAQQPVATATSYAEFLRREIRHHKISMALVVIIFVAGTIFTLYELFSRRGSSDSDPSRAAFQHSDIVKIPYSDKVRRSIAISPNGEYFAMVEVNGGYQSVLVKRISTNTNEQKEEPGRIVPPDKVTYYGLTFTHDGRELYYVKLKGGYGTLYRVNLHDGISTKLVEDIDSGAALSPDGKRIAFLRRFYDGGKRVLIIANEDGSGEQELLTRKEPEILSGLGGGIGWSPDGKMIAFGSGSNADGGYLSLVSVQVDGRTEELITPPIWSSIEQIAWLSDGSGLVMTAAQREPRRTEQQIWYVSYPGGETRQITNDLSTYVALSMTVDSKKLVTVRSEVVSHFWVVPNGDASRANKITSGNFGGYNLSCTPSGKLLYVSKTSGNEEIWVMNPDGTNEKQLTRNTTDDYAPTASPDGRYVVFVSDRTGNPNIWRMDVDGSNPRQLSKGTNDREPKCSPDSRSVIYTSSSSGKMTLWKVSIDGGAPEMVTDKISYSPAISPDGKWVACVYKERPEPSPWVTGIIPFEGGPPRKVSDTALSSVRWTRDGRALVYIRTEGEISNVWIQPIDGGPPKQLTHFKELTIYSFDWTYDGKVLACERGSGSRTAVLISDAWKE